MTSLVWVIPVVTLAWIWRVLTWRGLVAGVRRGGLVGMRRRAGFILARRRAETRRHPGTIPAQAPRSSTDPRVGRKKGFR